MNQYELAQLNVAELVAPLDSVELTDFVANLEGINALADSASGFVWRLQTDDGDATGITDFGAEFIVNMSVWTDIESLHRFVYQSGHIDVMKRRKEWFGRMENPYSVLWWIPDGHRPSTIEARSKLDLLRAQGSTKDAFTFKKAFYPPTKESEGIFFDDSCVAT